MPSFAAIDKIIQKNWRKLQKPGVLAVRPGYMFAGGWITHKPAVVAIVNKKLDKVPPRNRLPSHLDGVPVDIQEASPFERLRHTNPEQHAEVATARPEYDVPAAPFERTMNKTAKPSAPAAAHAAAKKAKKKPIKYTPPANAKLDAVTDTMSIICHASPDAGWLQLKDFLSGIKNTLTVGLYDLTSAHILAALNQDLAGQKKLMIVLDHPGDNQTADQSDEQSRAALAKAMGNRAQTAWALDGMDPLAKAQIFPTAYHIKVAVRDSSVFWLSSGNWNNSNQPAIDPFTNPQQAGPIAKKSDRDWHAIVSHAGLAKTFEAFLQHDYTVAKPENAPNPVPPTPLKKKSTHKNVEAGLDKRVPPVSQGQFFKPFVINNEKITVQPLLTPDNYGKNMLALIQGAKQKLYIQTQYIHPSKNADDLQQLLFAVRDKMKAGLDVRIILSEFEGTPGLDALKQMNIDTSLVRLQNGVHNKGFVVDSQIVALGSQNWSDQGAQTNRDATLIIHHEGAAKYYEQIFIHDWTTMAKQSINV